MMKIKRILTRQSSLTCDLLNLQDSFHTDLNNKLVNSETLLDKLLLQGKTSKYIF
jgi:hypothetical protein